MMKLVMVLLVATNLISKYVLINYLMMATYLRKSMYVDVVYRIKV